MTTTTLHIVTHGYDYDSGGQVHLFTNKRAARHAHDFLVKHAERNEFVDLGTIVVHDTYRDWRADPTTPVFD